MKLTISQAALLPILQATTSIVSSRTTLPILGNLLLEAADGKLSVSATDLDTGIRLKVDADISKDGSATIPARKFLSIIRELPAGEIEISVNDKRVTTISAGTSQFKINGLAEDDFPPLPEVKDGHGLELEQPVLAEMLRLTSYAISTDESRYVLNGVLFKLADGKLTLVSTDGRRLALLEKDVAVSNKNFDMIVPTKAIQELTRNLGKDGVVKIHADGNFVVFELPAGVVTSKLIEGSYPNFMQVIPKDNKKTATAVREDLLTAVKRIAVLASEKTNTVKFIFGKNQLTIKANTPEVGEAEQTMEINYSGKPIEISFNPEFAADPLRVMTQENVEICLTDGLSPAVFRPVIPEGVEGEAPSVAAKALGVLMPMRG